MIWYNHLMTLLRAQFDGKVLIPQSPPQLEVGHIYDVEVRDIEKTSASSPQEIVQYLKTMPRIPPEDIDAMEKAIEEAQRAAKDEPLFEAGDTE
jgi:hypothetical protein